MDSAPDGTRFYWVNDDVRDAALLDAQFDFYKPTIGPTQQLMKQARKRFVFRQPTADGSVVIKLFPLRSFVSRVQYPKYAYREFYNMRIAADLNLPVPDAIGYLEKRWFGLVTSVGLVQQDLKGYAELSDLFKTDRISLERFSTAATNALSKLYWAGANHLDIRTANVLMHPDTDDIQIIDWQYASFVSPRTSGLLEHLTGYFLRHAPRQRKLLLDTNWLSQLHAASGHKGDQHSFESNVRNLSISKLRMSQRTRLSLVLPTT
ncbi:hypothetical protein [uncultured Tateyamaria sp.]|uniref:hypothetical protein n=1 Tax=uncultured Tateyamaria sp. TaxID=455651 RepID=UPI00262F5EB8|nr:hypothetical protein [uncultured Tateyamaria sp.]